MPEPGWVALLTLDHEHGTAAVFRDATGGHWLSSTSEGGSGLAGYEPALESLEGGVVIVGGLVPPGAERTLVRDGRGTMVPARSGNGAWLARLLDHDMFVPTAAVFHDSAGELVPRPLPEGAAVEPVSDADSPCAGCGAAQWQRIRWTHRWEAENLDEVLDALRCVRCGHTVEAGAVVSSEAVIERTCEPGDGGASEPPPDWLSTHGRNAASALAGAAFPIYGLERWDGPRSSGGWSSDGTGVTAVSLRHGESGRRPHVEVETMCGGEEWLSDRELCHRALAQELSEAPDDPQPPFGGSPAAISLWFARRERDQSERAARAAERTERIPVDGEPRSFHLLAEGDRWAAAGRLERGAIVLSAQGVAPGDVALVRIEDGAPYLGGPT
jgi:hypothetical protein